MKTLILLVVAVVALSGCAGMRQQQAERQRMLDSTTPHCNNEQECKEKWSAAQVWVSRNVPMKIQVATDSIIETFGSTQHNSVALAASVTKEPIGGGRYKITIRTGCYNPFGCSPDAYQAALNFHEYLNSLTPKG